jgi:hypothetical protein
MLKSLSLTQQHECKVNAGHTTPSGEPVTSATYYKLGHVDTMTGYRVSRHENTRRWSKPVKKAHTMIRAASYYNTATNARKGDVCDIRGDGTLKCLHVDTNNRPSWRGRTIKNENTCRWEDPVNCQDPASVDAASLQDLIDQKNHAMVTDLPEEHYVCFSNLLKHPLNTKIYNYHQNTGNYDEIVDLLTLHMNEKGGIFTFSGDDRIATGSGGDHYIFVTDRLFSHLRHGK